MVVNSKPWAPGRLTGMAKINVVIILMSGPRALPYLPLPSQWACSCPMGAGKSGIVDHYVKEKVYTMRCRLLSDFEIYVFVMFTSSNCRLENFKIRYFSLLHSSFLSVDCPPYRYHHCVT